MRMSNVVMILKLPMLKKQDTHNYAWVVAIKLEQYANIRNTKSHLKMNIQKCWYQVANPREMTL